MLLVYSCGYARSSRVQRQQYGSEAIRYRAYLVSPFDATETGNPCRAANAAPEVPASYPGREFAS